MEGNKNQTSHRGSVCMSFYFPPPPPPPSSAIRCCLCLWCAATRCNNTTTNEPTNKTRRCRQGRRGFMAIFAGHQRASERVDMSFYCFGFGFDVAIFLWRSSFVLLEIEDYFFPFSERERTKRSFMLWLYFLVCVFSFLFSDGGKKLPRMRMHEMHLWEL